MFDSLVFGERQPKEWAAGSNNFRRTRDLKADAETAKPGEPVHVATAYHADGRIAVYRNGRPHGEAYTPAGDGPELQTYKTGLAHFIDNKSYKPAHGPFPLGTLLTHDKK